MKNWRNVIGGSKEGINPQTVLSQKGGTEVKYDERTAYFQENRTKLSRSQMADKLGISEGTVRDYERKWGNCLTTDRSDKLAKVARSLGISEEEAIVALKSLNRGVQPQIKPTQIPISRESFKFGYFSDAHIGHEKFKPELFDYMVRFFDEEQPDFILNPGDHLEGMSGRPGHVYELTHIGFDQQIDYATELYRRLDHYKHYGIDGNHDQWFFKKHDNGVIVGKELESRLTNYHHLGQDEGDIEVNGIRIKLFHAGDGSAYAISYKMQKLIESFSGGEKPHIVLSGHYHKAMNMFSRGVHGFECGTLCGQSRFMRGKKIPAMMGFGIITVTYNETGVERLDHTFVPWYEKGA